MAITIRNQRVEERIRQLGRLRKEGPSAVIARLVDKEFRALDLDGNSHVNQARRYAELRAWLDGLPPLTDEDRRAIDQAGEDMYDANGLPQVIVLETSALVAIYKREADAHRYLRVMAEADMLVLPATCLVESVMTLSRFASAPDDFERLVDRHGIVVSTVDEAIAKEAVSAFLRYGKGRGHPAQLNFGDCFSYAVAKHLDAPLLYKGSDFIHTDIESALPA